MNGTTDFRKDISVLNSDRKNLPLVFDAWSRPKAILDYSLFHGVFVPSISNQMWIEAIDRVEQGAFVNFTSENGMLKCTGVAGQENFLMSKRHPRYQPNRGHLFSTSAFIPTASTTTIHEFGIFHHQAGICFRVVSSKIYAVKKNMVGGVISEIEEEITNFPEGFDLTKGNNYDIQMQWRGVGDIFFYINDKRVLTMKLVGTLTEVSVFNPALPIAFQITGEGTMFMGCVDVSSEGGNREARERGNVDSGEISLSANEIPASLIYLPNAIDYNGVNIMNTRDIVLSRVTGFADDSATLKVYITRDGSQFTGTIFADYDDIASVRYSHNGSIILPNGTVNLSRLLTRRVQVNTTEEITNPDPDSGQFFVTHGDYILVTLQAKQSSIGGGGIEWSAEI